MIPESTNSFFGRSVNPHNIVRSCGGSSGGEGALVASKSSIIGIGTDIGGSVRIPANFCGVYGFKPCWKRGTYKGNEIINWWIDNLNSGEIKAVFGPLATNVDDCAIMQEFLFSESLAKFDYYAAPSHFEKEIY